MQLFKDLRLLKWFLVLMAVHSFTVGLGLTVLPFGALAWLGFTVDPYRFFSTQGGVFHIVMSVAYLLAARKPLGERTLLRFIIVAKIMAFCFLTAYFIFGERVPVIALSAIGDGLMGLIVLIFYRELLGQRSGRNA